MRAQHDKLQEEYAQQELLGGAASLGLQKGIDDEAISINKGFIDETKKAADDLATKGFIDAGRRRNLSTLKQLYSEKVLPIQDALQKRNEAVKIDREMKLKDETYESKFDPSSKAVTSYFKDNNAFTPTGASKAIVAQDVAQQMTQLKVQIQRDMP
jgi:hypothetical protein